MNKDDLFEVSIKGTHFNMDMKIRDSSDLDAFMRVVVSQVHDWYTKRYQAIKQILPPEPTGIERLNQMLQGAGLPGMIIDPNQPLPDDVPDFIKEMLYDQGVAKRPSGPAEIFQLLKGGLDGGADTGSEDKEPDTGDAGLEAGPYAAEGEHPAGSDVSEQSTTDEEVGEAHRGDREDPHRNNPAAVKESDDEQR